MTSRDTTSKISRREWFRGATSMQKMRIGRGTTICPVGRDGGNRCRACHHWCGQNQCGRLVFQMLRANDLIWPYVINNYLKVKSPAAFDLLYWNADSTNLSGPMYSWYLRNMYLENNLRVPGKLTMCGVPVDLGRIDMPAYVLATQEDHIVPWKSAWRSSQLLGRRNSVRARRQRTHCWRRWEARNIGRSSLHPGRTLRPVRIDSKHCICSGILIVSMAQILTRKRLARNSRRGSSVAPQHSVKPLSPFATEENAEALHGKSAGQTPRSEVDRT